MTASITRLNGKTIVKDTAKQPRPYVAALPYYLSVETEQDSRGNRIGPTNTQSAQYENSLGLESHLEFGACNVQAYDRVLSQAKASANASVGNSIAEGHQALSMIANRSLQLASALVHWKKLRFGHALEVLGFRRTRDRRHWVRGNHKILNRKLEDDANLVRHNVKSTGGLWLEYHFGWSPLYKDVRDAIETVRKRPPLETRRVKGSARVNRDFSYAESYYSSYFGGTFTTFYAGGYEYKIGYSTSVRVSNPNTALLNNLGLVNPASVLWEVTPFSFLIDWWLPVGKFIETWTDQIGYEFTNTSVAKKRTYRYDMNATLDKIHGEFTPARVVSTLTRFSRSVLGSLPSPSFRDYRGKGISSWERAATAVALLTNNLKSIRS